MMNFNRSQISKKRGTPTWMLMLLILICITTSIVVFVLALDRKVPTYYQTLVILPLNFMVISLVFINVLSNVGKSLSITLVVMLYFLRMVIHPLTMAIGNYSTYRDSIYMLENFDTAVVLLSFEAICVYLIININANRLLDSFKYKVEISKEDNTQLFKIIMTFFAFIGMFILIIYPNTRYNFVVGVFSSIEKVHQYNTNVRLMGATVPGAILAISIYLFTVFKFIIPIVVIKKIILKYSNENVVVLLSLIAVAFFSLINTPQRVYSIFIAISIFIMFCYIYPKKSKKIIGSLIVLGCLIAFGDLFFRSKLDLTGFIKGISKTINSYFGGVQNIAQSIEIPFTLTNIKYIINDLVGSIPFTASAVGSLETSAMIFNESLYGSIDKADQIIPMLGNGRIYFSSILSPLLTCILVYMGIIAEISMLKTSEIIEKYVKIYFCILCIVSTAMYGIEIFYTTTFRIVIPLYILVEINKTKFKIVKYRKVRGKR